MRKVVVGVFFIGGLWSAVTCPQVFPAAEQHASPSVQGSSSEEVEAAINSLAQPVDQEQVGQIFEELGRISDSQERDRLQTRLNERLQQLLSMNNESLPPISIPEDMSGKTGTSPQQGPSVEELGRRIQALKLGPRATADDLRARNELVSTVIGVRDPIQREQLLDQLDNREREAEAASHPASDHTSK